MTMKNYAKREEVLICCFKVDMRNFTNFDLSTRKSQKFFTLIVSFWAKYILFELKKYRGVIFHKTEEGYKIWRGIDFSLTWEIWQIFIRALKSVKIGTLMGTVQTRKGMTLKFAEELFVTIMKNNEKFEEGLTCHFKTDMTSLTNFDSSTRKCKKIAL